MYKLRQLEQGRSQTWHSLGVTASKNVYSAINDGDIYNRPGGTGLFYSMGLITGNTQGIATAINGDVYIAVYQGDILFQQRGIGSFVPLNQTHRYWVGMAAAPNGNIYATTLNEDVYVQVGGVGDFIPLNLPLAVSYWFLFGITVAPNGDIYIAVYEEDIFIQRGGTGPLVATGQGIKHCFALTALPNGNILAAVFEGSIYEQVGGVGLFIDLGLAPANWRCIAAYDNNCIYVAGDGISLLIKDPIVIPELQMDPGAEYNFAVTNPTLVETFTIGSWSGNETDFTVFDSEDGVSQATIYAPAGCVASYSTWKNIRNFGEPIIVDNGTNVCYGNCEGIVFVSGELVGTHDTAAIVAQAQVDNNTPPTNGNGSLLINETCKVNNVVYNGNIKKWTVSAY